MNVAPSSQTARPMADIATGLNDGAVIATAGPGPGTAWRPFSPIRGRRYRAPCALALTRHNAGHFDSPEISISFAAGGGTSSGARGVAGLGNRKRQPVEAGSAQGR